MKNSELKMEWERFREAVAREKAKHREKYLNLLAEKAELKKQFNEAQEAIEKKCERFRAEAAQDKNAFLDALVKRSNLKKQLNEAQANVKESERLRAEAAERELNYQEKCQNLAAEKVELEKQLCEAQANEKAALETCLVLQKDAAEKSEKLEKDRTCVVCMDAKRDTVFLECGHLVACEACAKEIAECCVCRRMIDEKKKVFY
uniref:RING-type domain-containing protein n=1 Tax=Steinernema glaseri TaxID=37863 RepID=A0A1I8A9K7_9BILA